MTNRIATTCMLLAGGMSLSTAAAAQQATPAPIAALTACRGLTDAAARLACFDQAAAALDTAVSQKNLVVLDREAVRKTRRSLFGFGLPRLPFFGDDDDENEAPEAREITAAIASAQPFGYNKWRIKLEDGALWETTEAYRGFKQPGPGTKVVIKAGPLGSYVMRIGGERGVKAKRVG
jgi:hypothetical protein